MNPPTSPAADPRYNWDRHPQPHAPPAITVPPPPPPHHHIETVSVSQYLPQRSRNTRSPSAWTNSETIRSLTKDPELGKQPTPPHTPGLRDRLSKYLFDIRMPTRGRDRDSEWVPMQEPPLQAWPPLEIEKRRFCEHCQTHTDGRRRNKILIAVLVLILLGLLGSTIALAVRLSSSQSSSTATPSAATPSPSANATTSDALSADAQQCLSQYTVNAPSDPSSYPCSTCLSVLQQVPPSFAQKNPGEGMQIQNAIQFCGLRSIFETSSGDGQTGLSNAGWAKDVRFCAWQGVKCDGFGRVSSIQLTFPAVPAKIPDEVTALTGLTSLQIIGDTNIPAGDLPTSFNSLSMLTSLQLESTAINTIPSPLLSSLGKLTTLTLVKNVKMTGDMTSGFTALPLQNLVVNNQALPTNPISALLSSPAARSLQILDLSSTSLNGGLPTDLSGFTALTELHLDSNALTNPLPSKFPPNLQALTLTNNTQLGGAVQSGTSFCGSSGLKTCDVRGSGLSVTGGACGVCQFP
ncbi:L domain-like protein [Lentinus brumalis]|uniref:L domain-like protein n=1 Tax=Lentinus brumalis TaxID=2498619 RepID=A0A371CT05_9APHY|nr:L domain-like protein [Polyporus brumalis]